MAFQALDDIAEDRTPQSVFSLQRLQQEAVRVSIPHFLELPDTDDPDDAQRSLAAALTEVRSHRIRARAATCALHCMHAVPLRFSSLRCSSRPDDVIFALTQLIRLWYAPVATSYRDVYNIRGLRSIAYVSVQYHIPYVFALESHLGDGTPITSLNYSDNVNNVLAHVSATQLTHVTRVACLLGHPTRVELAGQTSPLVVSATAIELSTLGIFNLLAARTPVGIADNPSILMMIDPSQLQDFGERITDGFAYRGLPVSPGKVVAPLALIRSRYHPFDNKKYVLAFNREFTPDDVQMVRSATAVITSHGGMTSHLAVACRHWAIPLVQLVMMCTNDSCIFEDGRRWPVGSRCHVDASYGSVHFGVSDDGVSVTPRIKLECKAGVGILAAAMRILIERGGLARIPGELRVRIADLLGVLRSGGFDL